MLAEKVCPESLRSSSSLSLDIGDVPGPGGGVSGWKQRHQGVGPAHPCGWNRELGDAVSRRGDGVDRQAKGRAGSEVPVSSSLQASSLSLSVTP